MKKNFRIIAALALVAGFQSEIKAFQYQGYEWEIFNNGTEVRCDGFVWGQQQIVADVPAYATNAVTQKTYPCTYIYSINMSSTVEKVVIPASVWQFGDDTFMNDINLKSVEWPYLICPESLIEYDDSHIIFPDGMFRNCQSLTELSTPKLSANIPIFISEKFCSGCINLKKIVISSECMFIGSGAFQDCTSLRQFYIYSVTPPTIAKDAFSSSSRGGEIGGGDGAVLYVPEESVDLYKNSDWNTYFATIEVAPVMEDSGLDDIVADSESDGKMEIYNLNGVFVGSSADSLLPGVYVLRQGKIAKKIIVK